MTVLRRLLTRLLSPRVFTGGICGSAQQENRGFPSIQDLQELVKRLVHQQKSLTSAAASRDGETTDPRRPLVLPSKEAMKLCEKSEAVLEELEEIRACMRSESDTGSSAEKDLQMFSLLEKEQQQLRRSLYEIRSRLIESLVSSENPDETSVILEVMSGRTTGGDICQQFTAKLLEMYQRFASYKSWHWEVLKHTPTECGLGFIGVQGVIPIQLFISAMLSRESECSRAGVESINLESVMWISFSGSRMSSADQIEGSQNELKGADVGSVCSGGLHYASVRVTGDSVFRALCFEAGTHRVQVIPDSGLSSRMQRIHTGTATVIVLPDTQEMMVHVSAKDLRIDTFRSGGAGGQHVNSTDSAVRVTHLPTGTVCECQQYRSQLKNRQTALSELRSRLEQSMVGKQQELLVHSRVTQVGTRHQAERIRTYNFTQGRVTDHRIGFETRNIKEFMRGASLLEELHQLLQEKDQREKLMELMEISGQNMKSS
ncbi:hypothetical protein DNTS_003502 [Danionella cerebrum]|uniref:Prokaryotic-type class I peptide chain release factors domain-containing protein n=1 Tax=Danionella cerebrum TaxID=2873325 RepID=A0A553MLH2_9TELE|nr:hypothetical protein DNTS_003502 [Danionella translucida]